MATLMNSKFEDALLRYQSGRESFRATLFGYLSDGDELLNLGRTSRVLRDLLGPYMYNQLYIRAPIDESKDTTALARIATRCHSLTIIVDHTRSRDQENQSFDNQANGVNTPRTSEYCSSRLGGRKAVCSVESTSLLWPWTTSSLSTVGRLSSPLSCRYFPLRSTRNQEKQMWIGLLSRFHNLSSLTLRLKGDAAWPGCTDIEEMIVVLRLAIENSGLNYLREVNFNPIHAMGVVHLAWSSFGAFGESSPSGSELWQKIHTIDMRVFNPFTNGKVSASQQLMFKKILYEYLRRLAPTLQCLRFMWLGGDGPSPLTLHLEPEFIAQELSYEITPEIKGHRHREPIVWPRLSEFWMGNALLPHRTIRLARQLAPRLTGLKLLRSTSKDEPTLAVDSLTWMDVLLAKENSRSENLSGSSTTSSVHSQDDFGNINRSNDGISISSGVVPFMLDL